MTEQQFFDHYTRTYTPKEKQEWKDEMVAMRCHCDYKGCEGWAMVTQHEGLIRAHIEFSQKNN